MNRVEPVVRRVDAFRQRHLVLAFVFGLLKKYGDDNAGSPAIQRTYSIFTTIFALLLLLVTTLDLVLAGAPSTRDAVLRSIICVPILPDPPWVMPQAIPYTHGHHESVLRSHRWRTAENSASFLLPHLASGTSLLDVGCGPGTITIDLARRVAPGRVVGVDAAAEALAVARAEPDAALVEFRSGDVMALPFDDGTFDVVFAHQVLQHLADPVGAIGEMLRVAAPRGLVACREGEFSSMAWFPDDRDLEEWRDVYLHTARANGTEPDAARRLVHWAHEAGAFDVTASATAWCFASESERAWWGALWADRMVLSTVAALALDHGAATAGDLQRFGQAWRRWADEPDGWFAMINGEILVRKAAT